ncbi:unnamed protein product [Rhodiola kirilowii]
MSNCLVSREIASEHTQSPHVTGTSVIGIKYKEGILIASDMGGRFTFSQLSPFDILIVKVLDVQLNGCRIIWLHLALQECDFQEVCAILMNLVHNDNMCDDNNSLGPKELLNYLTRVMYDRRNKFDPLWNSLVLGGVKNGQIYLATVNMIGVHYEDDHVAIGLGNHLARPILRAKWHKDLRFEKAVELLEECMRVLIHRDRSAINKIQIAQITEAGAKIYPPYSLKL